MRHRLNVSRYEVRREPLQETPVRRSPEQLQPVDQTRSEPLGEFDRLDRSEAHAADGNGELVVL